MSGISEVRRAREMRTWARLLATPWKSSSESLTCGQDASEADAQRPREVGGRSEESSRESDEQETDQSASRGNRLSSEVTEYTEDRNLSEGRVASNEISELRSSVQNVRYIY